MASDDTLWLMIMPLIRTVTISGQSTIGAISLLALLGVSPPAAPRHGSAEAAPEWNLLFNQVEGWTGGDCAGTVLLPDGRVLWLFGDSWIGPVRNGRRDERSTMVNNTIAFQSIHEGGATPRPDDMSFHWGTDDAGGKPTAWIAPNADAIGDGRDKHLRYWPTGGGIVAPQPNEKQALFIFLMRIREKEGADDGWNFENCGSAIVRVENPEAPVGNWNIKQSTLTRIPVDSNNSRRVVWGAAAIPGTHDKASPPATLIFGVDVTDGLNKKLLVARAPCAAIDQIDSWEYRTQRGWTKDPHAARPIADNVMDELSIDRVPYGGANRWVMIYSKPILEDKIIARTAPNPLGPWSAPREVYRCPEPASDRRLIAYSAKGHPELSADGGILATYCINSGDFAHMARDASVYRPRFVRISLSQVFGQSNAGR